MVLKAPIKRRAARAHAANLSARIFQKKLGVVGLPFAMATAASRVKGNRFGRNGSKAIAIGGRSLVLVVWVVGGVSGVSD